MKTTGEPNEMNRLLDAVLADGTWHATKRELHRQALSTIRTVRRRRQVGSWLGRATAVVVLLAAMRWALTSSAERGTAHAMVSREIPASALASSAFITEDQMLAMFPSGSCVVAEVDGQKELVFFDAKNAGDGFVLPGTPH